jgi:hypothetical protein
MAASDFDFMRAAPALTKLVDSILSEPSLREQFRKDPFTLAREFDIDVDGIPERVVKTLAGLSVDELRLLTELNTVFKEEGLEVETGSTLMVY